MNKEELFESIYTEMNKDSVEKIQESNDSFLNSLMDDFFEKEETALANAFGDKNNE